MTTGAATVGASADRARHLGRGAGQRGIARQIPRNALALLMVAQAVAVLPFLFHVSPWIIAVGLFCAYWRSGVHQGRWDYPKRWVKAVLVAASVGSIVASGVPAFSLEAAASLLILAFSLKLIETRGRRDAYLVIFLGYFVIATAFLFDQSMALAAYQVVALMVVTAAMVGLNQHVARVRPLGSLKVAVVLVLQALPLTLVMFLLFPRIAPLWTMPLPSASSTGLSERMKPGDVAELIRSDELAFRVLFDGPVPANRDLYWRGLTYSRFSAGTWSVGGMLPQWPAGSMPAPVPGRGTVRYEVLLEPTQSDWLFALDVPVELPPGASVTRDYRLEAEDPVMSLQRYRVASDPDFVMDGGPRLPAALQRRETWYPEGDNPRTQAYADDLWDRTGSADAFVAEVLADIRRSPYFYTLSPPRLPDDDSIDNFWLDTRRGFCTHYAGALVFMLRSVGVPARMVGGYQGGAVNPVTGHLVVRQYDAHAWAEYWLPGRGWQRADPTSAVAPARIEQGLDAALSEADRASLSALTSTRLRGISLVRDLLYWADSMEYRWNLWVVGFDVNLQSRLLQDLLGGATPTRIGAALLVGGGLGFGLVALTLFWRRRPAPRHPVERSFRRFCEGVGRAGWPRQPGEAPGAFLTRLAGQGALAEDQARGLIADLNRLLYNPDPEPDGRAFRQFDARLRRARFRLMLGSVR